MIAGAAAAALATLLVWCYRGPSLPKSLVKTASVAGLALAAWWAAGPVLLVVALALGALGDLALSRDGSRAFLLGLGAFAAAHVAYIVLLLDHGGVPVLDGASLILIAFAVAYGAILYRAAGDLRGPVVIYVGIIAVMGLCALGLGGGLAFGAALLFILSDTVLGAQLFLLDARGRVYWVANFVIWASYWSAQCLFLLAFVPALLG